MSGRTTGATPEQIEAACKLKYERTSMFSDKHPWDGLNQEIRSVMSELFSRDHASYLVRPDQRIVEVADLKRMSDFFEFDIADDEDHESYKRITALIGGEV